jgi:multicomponent Na+:H+ antiporter subunit E
MRWSLPQPIDATAYPCVVKADDIEANGGPEVKERPGQRCDKLPTAIGGGEIPTRRGRCGYGRCRHMLTAILLMTGRARTGNMRFVSLGSFLFVFWLVLSGHYTPMLITAGAVSAVLCVLAAVRVRAADEEGHPIEVFAGTLTYYPWLLVEIGKSAWTVTKVILHPSLPISPTMTVVTAGQKTTAGLATYANSITLTPGTITVGVDGNELTVHALVREGALDLEGGGMDRRVCQFEGNR